MNTQVYNKGKQQIRLDQVISVKSGDFFPLPNDTRAAVLKIDNYEYAGIQQRKTADTVGSSYFC